MLKSDHNLTPGLAVVLVGEDPASQVYVRNKGIATKEVGMNSLEFRLPADTSQEALLDKVRALNNDPEVHGILVQFPVPEQISQQAVIDTISPEKDVDGLHPVNAGRLASGHLTGVGAALVPCTPQGSVLLARAALVIDRRACRGGGSVEFGRQAGRAIIAWRKLHGQHRPFAHARPAGPVPECRYSRRRCRHCRNGQGRLGQAGCVRHRCRH